MSDDHDQTTSAPLGTEAPDAGAGEPGAPDVERTSAPVHPFTLAVDVGGTGIKASVLDATGKMVADRVRVDTTYPLAPDRFVSMLHDLVQPLPASERVSVGFPGVVRNGRIVTAPHFVTKKGPGSKIVPELATAWSGFDAEGELASSLGLPVKVLNDADLQGLAVITGHGLEFVVTLGTGVGTALFRDGELAPHLELAHHPLAKDESYNERLGEAALLRIGPKRWRKRVLDALATLESLVNYDHCFVGGGNSRHLVGRLPVGYEVVDNIAGILGGIKLWENSPSSGAGTTASGSADGSDGAGPVGSDSAGPDGSDGTAPGTTF